MFNFKKQTDYVARLLAVLLLLVFVSSNVVVITAMALDNRMVASQAKNAIVMGKTECVLKSTPVLFNNCDYSIDYDVNKNQDKITIIEEYINQLDVAIKSGSYTAEACELMSAEALRLETIKSNINSFNLKLIACENEYYYATKTWIFLKQQGYSDVIASAIIGNMMIETSGGSLSLKPTIYNPTGAYYGLCQWSLYYRPEAADMSFEDQLTYLQNDIEKEFKVFGKCYKNGFTFEDFLAMNDPSTAAQAFAAVYERCGSGSYDLRKQAAVKAYNYFNFGV